MNDFSAAVTDYLQLRRAMGYKLVTEGRLLPQFAAYLDAAGVGHLRIAHAVAWATQSPSAAPAWRAGRLAMVRALARYLSSLDPETEIPPGGLLPQPSHRVVPYIFSDSDISQIIDEAGRLNPEHRADTYQTVIKLIFATGMRVGEAVRLDNDDVDFEDGVITIRNSKFGKSRQVPLHPTSVEALGGYRRRRDRRRPNPKSPGFFTSSIGTRLLRDNISTVFPRLVRAAGLASPTGRRPRLHDARHTFAVRTILSWYRAGIDVHQRLPLLSTYLGHVDPTTTYWYLSTVPELVELIAGRLDADNGEQWR